MYGHCFKIFNIFLILFLTKILLTMPNSNSVSIKGYFKYGIGSGYKEIKEKNKQHSINLAFIGYEEPSGQHKLHWTFCLQYIYNIRIIYR